MINIVIADDHPIVLDGLEGLLRREPGFRVVARCTNGLEAVTCTRKHRPDVLILDVQMPELDGYGVLGALEREQIETSVILLTASLDKRHADDGTRAGAAAVVLKERASRDIVATIHRVYKGERGVGVGRRITPFTSRKADDETRPTYLTERETELARLVVRGLRNKEIAETLGISEGTVKIHLHSVYKKLGVESRTELLIRANALELA